MGRRGTPRRLGVPGEELRQGPLRHRRDGGVCRHARAGRGRRRQRGRIGGRAREPARHVGDPLLPRRRIHPHQGAESRASSRRRSRPAEWPCASRARSGRSEPMRWSSRSPLDARSSRTTSSSFGSAARPYPFLERIGVRIVGKEIALVPPAPAKSAATAGHALALLGAIAALTLAPRPARSSRPARSPPLTELDGTALLQVPRSRQRRVDGRALPRLPPRRGVDARARARPPCARAESGAGVRSLPSRSRRQGSCPRRWDEGSSAHFDHGRTGFLLQGKHQGLDCRPCHQPTHQRSPAAALIRAGIRGGASLDSSPNALRATRTCMRVRSAPPASAATTAPPGSRRPGSITR